MTSSLKIPTGQFLASQSKVLAEKSRMMNLVTRRSKMSSTDISKLRSTKPRLNKERQERKKLHRK